jgi:hypothetical protein
MGQLRLALFAIVGVETVGSVRVAAIVEELGVIRVEPNGLIVVLNGTVGSALGIVGVAPAVADLRVIQVEPYLPVEISNGAIVGLAGMDVAARLRKALGRFRASPDPIG